MCRHLQQRCSSQPLRRPQSRYPRLRLRPPRRRPPPPSRPLCRRSLRLPRWPQRQLSPRLNRPPPQPPTWHRHRCRPHLRPPSRQSPPPQPLSQRRRRLRLQLWPQSLRLWSRRNLFWPLRPQLPWSLRLPPQVHPLTSSHDGLPLRAFSRSLPHALLSSSLHAVLGSSRSRGEFKLCERSRTWYMSASSPSSRVCMS